MKKFLIVLIAILNLLFTAHSFASDKNEDLSQYYFTGKIDINKYPEFKNCGYKEGLEVKFYIYDNKIFGECEGEMGLNSVRMSDGNYNLLTNENINLHISLINGELVKLKLDDVSKLNNQSKLNLKSNGCDVAKFIFKFERAYYFNEIKKQKKKDHKFYRVGEYRKEDSKYLFDFWFLDLSKYKNSSVASLSASESGFVEMKGSVCFKKISETDTRFLEEKLVSIKNCAAKEEDIYLKINNCIVTKYQGQLN